MKIVVNKRDDGISFSTIALDRIQRGVCVACEKPKSDWKQTRRAFKCCTPVCTGVMEKEHMYVWSWIRSEIYERDNKTCRLCSLNLERRSYAIDHIKPIALGGSQWDKSNMQLLCVPCHKAKTVDDIKGIAVLRKQEKMQEKGQILLCNHMDSYESVKGGKE